jgi:hypothetical protein
MYDVSYQSNKPPISTSSSGSSTFLTSLTGSDFLASGATGAAVVYWGAATAVPVLPCNRLLTLLPLSAFSNTFGQIGSTLRLAALRILANLVASI